MNRSRWRGPLALFAVAMLLMSSCSSRGDDSSDDGGDGGDGGNGDVESSIDIDDCETDPTAEIEGDTIKLVSSYPQSELVGAFAEIARGWAAYFDKVNEEGGVEIAGKSYQIEFEDKDDVYNPQQTASNIEELVGADGSNAFAVFSVVGTANNINVRDFLGELCVPNLFAATGSVAWGNPDYPWLLGSTLAPYTLEAQAFADYLKENQPEAKVAMLVQNDEFGATYEQGFRQAIEGTDIEVVAVEEYPSGADEVSTQVASLAASDADAFFNGATLLACPDALTSKQDEGWEPTTWVSATCISKTLMILAGAAGDGALSFTNLKDPLNPAYADDPAMVAFKETVEQYRTDFKGRALDLENAIILYGYVQAEIFVQALEAAEAPTRLAVMESVHNIDGFTSDLAIDGVSFTTSGGDDPFLGESLRLVQYDAAAGHFSEIGELQDWEGETLSLTPEDLVNA
ncbi:MAG: ABC transporter substrate-binding protein [Acidimicrobiales bacterium]|nr:ABC transporter substrate-binding protein [Acidimicrobiales bacterium]